MTEEVAPLQLFFAHANDPKVLGGKVIYVEPGDNQMPCGNCGKEVKFKSDKLYVIDQIACSNSCADVIFFEPARAEGERIRQAKLAENPIIPIEDNDEVVLDGPDSAEDYSAEDSTPTVDRRFDTTKEIRAAGIPATITKPDTCTECGGPKKGRGYTHKDGCTLAKGVAAKSDKPVATCPACGGPAKGRGFTHKPDCLDVAKRKAEADAEAAAKPKCPECGGPKRGKGFTHKETCSKA